MAQAIVYSGMVVAMVWVLFFGSTSGKRGSI